MKIWKAFERLLPVKLRRGAPELPAADYLAHFAQVTDDNPAWRALMEFGRFRFLQKAAIVCDRAQSEALRFEAMRSACDLASFLDELEDERQRARAEFQKFQQTK